MTPETTYKYNNSNFLMVTQFSNSRQSIQKIEEIILLLGEWETCARSNWSQLLLLTQDSNPNTQDIIDKLCQSISICSVFKESLTDNKEKNINTFYICKDSNGHIQAIMDANRIDKEIFIKYIVTNPNNLLTRLGNGNGIKGAGRALITHIFEEAVTNEIESITLISVRSAASFYEMTGFRQVKKNLIGNIKMKITTEDIIYLYPHVGYFFKLRKQIGS